MDVKNVFELIAIVKNIFFAFLMTIASIVLFIDAKTDTDNNSVLMFMAISFLLAAGFLVYKSLPQRGIMIAINEFATRVHLGEFILGGIFLGGAAFGIKYMVGGGEVNWIKIVIFGAFIFGVIQMTYSHFFKKRS